MKFTKLIVVVAAAATALLSGCAPLILGAGISGGMFALGNKQRSACADLYDRAHKEKWSDAKTKAQGYRAGCR